MLRFASRTALGISFHFISFHFISFHFISFHFISFHFISFHFISFHFISFHFISFHFISFHFISFHFINHVPPWFVSKESDGVRLPGARASGARARAVGVQHAQVVVCLWCVWTDTFFARGDCSASVSLGGGVADNPSPTLRVCHRTHYTVTSLPLTDRGGGQTTGSWGFTAQHGLRVVLTNGRPRDLEQRRTKKTQRHFVGSKKIHATNVD